MPAASRNDLTAREHEVLALIAEGRSSKGICDNLFLSPKTVEAHVKHIFAKLRPTRKTRRPAGTHETMMRALRSRGPVNRARAHLRTVTSAG
ncbi:MAG TPA: helix-turn-helix transcriptional regulator [Gaiellaceae bacterium]|nr:helix-turn-helix transcriptional regulator [Gaiellaceae bacterium]